jgi:hypothetical protein
LPYGFGVTHGDFFWLLRTEVLQMTLSAVAIQRPEPNEIEQNDVYDYR